MATNTYMSPDGALRTIARKIGDKDSRYISTDEALRIIARKYGAGSNYISPDEALRVVAENIGSDDGGGGTNSAPSILNKTITEYIDTDSITSLYSYAFQSCTALTSVSFPACSVIGMYAFENCSSLTTVSFPSCEELGRGAFGACISLTEVDFPRCLYLKNSAFASCYSLAKASFPICSNIGFNIFASCRRLLSLYLLGSSVCTLESTNTFTSTPIAGHTTYTSGQYGSIYVPASLYNSYRTGANWSYFSNRFVSLTDEQIAALDAGN